MNVYEMLEGSSSIVTITAPQPASTGMNKEAALEKVGVECSYSPRIGRSGEHNEESSMLFIAKREAPGMRSSRTDTVQPCHREVSWKPALALFL